MWSKASFNVHTNLCVCVKCAFVFVFTSLALTGLRILYDNNNAEMLFLFFFSFL